MIYLTQTWKRRTKAEFKAAAEKYKEARTKAEADKLLLKHGARWSELLRLPYWDPTRFVVIDVMHNSFLNLVKYHMRDVLQLEAAEAEKVVATSKEMDDGRKVWAGGKVTPSQLKKLKLCVLTGLCKENKISIEGGEGGKRLRKKDIVEVMVVSVP